MTQRRTFNIGKIMYLLGFFLLQVSVLCQNVLFITDKTTSIKKVSIAILAFACIFIIKSIKISMQKFMLLLFVILISILSYVVTKDFQMLFFSLLLIGSLNKKFDDIIKYDFYIKLLIFIFVLMCYFLGYTGQSLFMRNYVLRSSLGFIHPNVLGFVILMLFYDYIYVYNRNLKIKKMIIPFLVALYFLNICQARSAQLCIGITTLIFVFLSIRKEKTNINNKSIRRLIIKNLFWIFTFSSLYCTIAYINDASWTTKLNALLSNRLNYQAYFYQNYGISLFGNNIVYYEQSGTLVYVLDNLYVRLILNFGIVGLLYYYFIIKNIISHALATKNNIILVIFITLLVYGLMEWSIIRIALNPFLMFYIYEFKRVVGGEHD